MFLLSLVDSCYYHYYYYFIISIIYPKTYLFIYLLLSVLCYFNFIFCHLLDFSKVYYLLELFMFLSIYLYIYTFIYLFFIGFSLVYFLSSHYVVLINQVLNILTAATRCVVYIILAFTR